MFRKKGVNTMILILSKLEFFSDLINLNHFRSAITFIAWGDIRARYHRSLLGPLWIVLGLGIGSFGLGYLWSQIWGVPPEQLVPQITIGLLLWYFISACLTEGAVCLINQGEAIKNMNLPKSFFPTVTFIKQLLVFVHSWLIAIVAVFLFDIGFSVTQLLVIPGLFITLLNLFLIINLIAVLSARFRDLIQIINTAMPILFFMSPILFKMDQIEDLQWVMWLNPITYFIVLIRDPLLGHPPPLMAYQVSIAIFIVLLSLLIIILQKKINRIVGWI